MIQVHRTRISHPMDLDHEKPVLSEAAGTLRV